VLDCKGGRDARLKADRTRRLLYGAGARRVAVWPDEARLSLWDLPARDLAVLLYQMIESGTGAAAYYADILASTSRFSSGTSHSIARFLVTPSSVSVLAPMPSSSASTPSKTCSVPM
jgi:cytosine/adenosine deaminase-related metal-dependent hydrolase